MFSFFPAFLRIPRLPKSFSHFFTNPEYCVECAAGAVNSISSRVLLNLCAEKLGVCAAVFRSRVFFFGKAMTGS